MNTPMADIRRIPLADLHFSEAPAQIARRERYNPTALNELAETLKTEGQLEPILARPIMYNNEQRFEVVFGERRCRGMKMAGGSDILAIVRELDDHQAAKVRLIENLQREEEHPLAEAEGYEELTRQHGYTVEQIGAETGKSKAYVYARLKLLALGKEGRKAFNEGKLTASTALLVARIPVESLQKKATIEITTRGSSREPLSYREAAEWIQREYMLRLADAPFPTDQIGLVLNVGTCGACPKRTGNQSQLFEDVRGADVCTDPTCFKAKVAAWSQQQVEKAQAAGQKVIAGPAAKKVIAHGEYLLSTHVKLTDMCYEDPKQRTYKQLLGKEAKPDLLQLPDSGKLIEILPRAQALATLRKAGVLKAERRTPASSSSGSAKVANQKAQHAHEFDEEVEKRLFKAIHAKAPKQLPRPMLEELLDNEIGFLDTRLEHHLLNAWNWSKAPSPKELAKLSEPQLWQLLYEVRTLSDSAPDDAIELAAKALKIDAKKVRAEVVALKAPAPAKASKKKVARK